MIVASYGSLAVGCLAVTYHHLKSLYNDSNITVPSHSHLQAGSNILSSLKMNISYIFLAVIMHVVVFVLTLFLPHLWAITYMPLIHPNAYYVLDSPYSLVRNYKLYEGKITHWIEDLSSVGIGSNSSQMTNATRWLNDTIGGYNDTSGFDEMVSLIPDPDYLQPVIYLKLYQDVVVYFSIILGIIVVGVAGTYTPSLRNFLHKRVPMRFIPRVMNLWPTGASIGELSLFLSFLALNAYWFWFWSAGLKYRIYTPQNDDDLKDLQLYARVMGQMTTLYMSFLTFPIARNSVWESVFGVPFDRSIKYHRALGMMAWIFATLHMVVWQIKWLKKGTLAHNCWELSSLSNVIISGTLDDPIEVRQTDWTIPVMETVWLICTISLSIAVFLRARKYELFVFSHYFMMLFFVFGVLHAFSFWYYTAAGIGLYVFDKCIRMVNASRVFRIISIKRKSDTITEVTLPGAVFPHGHVAGQYAWICIPEISLFEWHPFTISSAPTIGTGENGIVTFHIQNRGPGTWTDKLSKLATLVPQGNTDLDIYVDGPYGRAIPYSESKSVVLVAGGIGITPMASILSEM